VVNHGSGTFQVIDTATNNVIATLPGDPFTIGVAVNPAGTLAYVTNENTNYVTVIRLASV
jgi:YVTN family beta-propeller protein